MSVEFLQGTILLISTRAYDEFPESADVSNARKFPGKSRGHEEAGLIFGSA